MSHPIDHQALRKAAEALQAIDDAGYGPQLDRELFDLTHGDTEFRLEQSRREFAERCGWADDFARRLAHVTDCPIEQARAIAIELSGARTRSSVALELLPRMAGEVRRLETQAARQRMQGRRTA